MFTRYTFCPHRPSPSREMFPKKNSPVSPDGPISQNVSIGPAFGWNQENSLHKHYHWTHFSAPLLLFCPHLDHAMIYEWWCWLCWRWLDLNDGQFSERCDVDGSFFNSDTDYFWKSLTSPLSQLFSLTIGNDYFSIILLILGLIILGLFTICPPFPPKRAPYLIIYSDKSTDWFCNMYFYTLPRAQAHANRNQICDGFRVS